MGWSENLATATLEERKTDLGTSPRVVRLIPRRAGSISSLYGAKPNLKAKKYPFATSKKTSRVTNGVKTVFSLILNPNGPCISGQSDVKSGQIYRLPGTRVPG